MNRNESWRNSANLKGVLVSLMVGFATGAIGGTNAPAEEGALCARAVVSEGDWARLHRQLDRARKGEQIVIGVIGGSITQGASASSPKKSYGNRVAARCLAMLGADVIVIPQATDCTCEIPIHRDLLRIRAYENEVCISMTNWAGPKFKGHSMMIGADGEVVRIGAHEEEILIAEFDMDALKNHRAKGIYGRHHRQPGCYGPLLTE